jgi:hypothetical protein
MHERALVIKGISALNGRAPNEYSTSAIDPNTSALAGGLSESRVVRNIDSRADAEAIRNGVIRMMIGARAGVAGVVGGRGKEEGGLWNIVEQEKRRFIAWCPCPSSLRILDRWIEIYVTWFYDRPILPLGADYPISHLRNLAHKREPNGPNATK